MSNAPVTPAEAPVGAGKLLLVATPIGNLQDLSERASLALTSADLIACEDTRRTGQLLHHLGTKRPLLSVHDHNERHRIARILEHLDRGETVALVSDAGTPLVSDPGYRLVRAAIDSGHAIEAVPGPAAFLAALIVSGLPTQPFTFVGFPPPKSGKRRSFLERYRDLPHTLVLYESPHRIARTLKDAHEIFGDRPAALSRELTKLHEETLRGTLGTLLDEDSARATWKGELVLTIGGQHHDS